MYNEAPIEVMQGSWASLGGPAAEIRQRVFIEEQAVPEHEEWDGRDQDCLHFVAYQNDRAIGTARLLPDGHVGRVAVLREGRGLGIGLHIMQTVIDTARRLNHEEIVLDAQLQAMPFYQKLGFKEFGTTFLDAGIEHCSMRLSLITR